MYKLQSLLVTLYNIIIDPRVQDWFLVYSPWPTISLCLGYLLMCYMGPRMMASRQPLELKPLLVLYNFAMVGLSVYIFMEVYLMLV